jgi:hypothetical protein
MYEYYFKPVKTGKTSCMEVVFLENGIRDDVETADTKTVFINYDHKNLQGKSAENILEILFEEIQNHIINLAGKNNWNIEPFVNVYGKITKNRYLFEEKHLKPLSNKVYKAQIVFKYDYQGSGVFLEFYGKNELINRVRFSNNGRAIINMSGLEWVNENTVRIYYEMSHIRNRKYYWEININGMADFDNINKNDPHELYNLGIIYYEGYGVIKDEKKGIELIKRSSEMGYKHGKDWINKKNNGVRHNGI